MVEALNNLEFIGQNGRMFLFLIIIRGLAGRSNATRGRESRHFEDSELSSLGVGGPRGPVRVPDPGADVVGARGIVIDLRGRGAKMPRETAEPGVHPIARRVAERPRGLRFLGLPVDGVGNTARARA